MLRAPARYYAETLERYIELLRSRLLEIPVSIPTYARLCATAAQIPARCFDYFGFERRLGADSESVDFAVKAACGALPWLCAIAPSAEVRALCGCALRCNGVRADEIWLEWDFTPSANDGVPSVYVTTAAPDRLSPKDRAQLCELVAPHHRIFLRVLEAVQPSCDRVHLGFMFSRGSRALRIGVLPMASRDIEVFLRFIGWRGDIGRMSGLVESFDGLCDAFSVQLDCLHDNLELAGTELLFRGDPRTHQPRDDPRWSVLFERLISRGLATAMEASALLRWPGAEHFSVPLIERHIARHDAKSGGRLLCGTLVTGLQHLKLSTRDATAVSAKAYFGAAFDGE